MSEPRKCSKCGAELPAGAAGVHCPQCLLTLGLATTQPAAPALNKTVFIPFVPGPPGEKEGDRIGRYTLLEKLGEGGMGTVWKAEQAGPVRFTVALKVIKPGVDAKDAIARFEAERQTLALMDHSNIAKLLDTGATETGRPYFVTEYVGGVTITDYCDRHTLATRQRLELFIQVCHAIEHAHRHGIIHRDIKPLNILVTLPKGENVPVPKVIDFGLARPVGGQMLGDNIVHTARGEFMGTPVYMSAEQAEMSGLDIDARSDIYSLGVLLYELLTGQTPLDAGRLAQAGRLGIPDIIRHEDLPPPSTKLSALDSKDLEKAAKHRQTEPRKLIRLVQGDLDWIVMKCLEKDRTRRYKSAEALATDVQRFLNHEPVVQPAPMAYRLQKLIRRNKLAFTVGSVAAFCAIIALLAQFAMFRGGLKNPPPKVLPESVKALAAAGVLSLSYAGAPPAPPPGAVVPQLRFAIQAIRRGAAEFRPLQDGDTLASEVDHYRLVAQPLSQGYLYIFQVDAAGKTQWLFPKNTFEFSSGANPIKPDQVLQLPPEEKRKTFRLDRTAGIEHVYIVFSAAPWPELEIALARPSQPLLPSGSMAAAVQQPNRLQTRGIETIDDTPPLAGASESPSAERIDGGMTSKLSVGGQTFKSSGAFMVVERWFKHVSPSVVE